jgi:hypothetical protein
MRHGYQTNHNLDPSVVGSSNFGQIFRAQLPGNFKGIGAEQIFSQPLVFTGNDGVQYLYIATTQNNIYRLNAKTGAILASRNLHVPFLTADLEGERSTHTVSRTQLILQPVPIFSRPSVSLLLERLILPLVSPLETFY